MTRFAALVLTGLLLTACSTDPGVPEAQLETQPNPGVPAGTQLPEVGLWDESGQPVRLASLYEQGPIVVTFYRGGWCPYCNNALSEWNDKVDELEAAGATLVAITPESPEKVVETSNKLDTPYLILSDYRHDAAKAFKVHFNVDDDTQTQYKSFGIDLADWNQTGTWELPAPGTFVIDRDGIVRWSFADWDYKKRADPDKVIAAVRDLQ